MDTTTGHGPRAQRTRVRTPKQQRRGFDDLNESIARLVIDRASSLGEGSLAITWARLVLARIERLERKAA